MHTKFTQWMTKVVLGMLVALSILPGAAIAQEAVSTEPVNIYVFQRDDCTFCKAEKAFLESLEPRKAELGYEVVMLDIVNDEEANALYQQVTTLKKVPRITPITVIGDTLIQGFDAPETTGERILAAVQRAHATETRLSLEDFIAGDTLVDALTAAGCDSADVCTIDAGDAHAGEFTFKLPFYGVVDLRAFSLSTLAVVLGTIDGFNPCAMWVLVTFLLILLQIGDRKKMWQVAGLFIVAEAVMYWLILNVWYSTWDFVGLDRIVTPVVGLIAIGGGAYFLYKYYKSREQLTCDVVDLEKQGKIHRKITEIASGPMTLAAIAGILGIALSVNIIEFACSVGIPQAFTKILEINHLTFLETQWYTFLYILFYMADDFVVFGLALWGSKKIHATDKYYRLSLLIGGILMVVLGVLLTFAPTLLTF